MRSPWYVATLLALLLVLPAAASACEPRQQGLRNLPPTADFEWTPNPVQAGDRVFAIDLSTDDDGQITQWAWTGPFGGAAERRNPNATIRAPGDYEVTLTVWDDCGDSDAVSKIIHVGSSPPRASFTFSPLHPTTADQVQFLDHSSDIDGSIEKRVWTTTGGQKSSTINPVHNFPEPGIYVVRLTVVDNDGLEDFQEQTIAVKPREFLRSFDDNSTPAPPLFALALAALAVARSVRRRQEP